LKKFDLLHEKERKKNPYIIGISATLSLSLLFALIMLPLEYFNQKIEQVEHELDILKERQLQFSFVEKENELTRLTKRFEEKDEILQSVGTTDKDIYQLVHFLLTYQGDINIEHLFLENKDYNAQLLFRNEQSLNKFVEELRIQSFIKKWNYSLIQKSGDGIRIFITWNLDLEEKTL
jgi:hypothetical protein